MVRSYTLIRNKGNGKTMLYTLPLISFPLFLLAPPLTSKYSPNIEVPNIEVPNIEVLPNIEVQKFKEEGAGGKRYKIKEVYEDHFVIDEDTDDDECFVFGYCIDDLHGIDKSYILTLNVCATQELHRRMETQNVIIKSQEEHIKELETKMTQILNYISL